MRPVYCADQPKGLASIDSLRFVRLARRVSPRGGPLRASTPWALLASTALPSPSLPPAATSASPPLLRKQAHLAAVKPARDMGSKAWRGTSISGAPSRIALALHAAPAPIPSRLRRLLLFSPLPLPHPSPFSSSTALFAPSSPVFSHSPPRYLSPLLPSIPRAGVGGGVRVDAGFLPAAPLRRPAARRAARAAPGGLHGGHGGQGARRGAGGGGEVRCVKAWCLIHGYPATPAASPSLCLARSASSYLPLRHVRGDDASNLPLTRVAQTHIWQHQFPPSCDHRRLLLADWLHLNADVAAGRAGEADGGGGMGDMEGLAREVHVVGGLLALAVLLNRTLPHQSRWPVSSPPSLGLSASRQQHTPWPPTRPVRALACASSPAAKEAAQGASQGLDELEALLTSADPVVRVCTGALSRHQLLLLANESRVATQWGAAVSAASQSVEVAGVVPPHDKHREQVGHGRACTHQGLHAVSSRIALNQEVWINPLIPSSLSRPFRLSSLQLHWWRSQAVRFLFRWPSAHLCHVTNLIRHISYGRYIAAQMHSAAQQQAAIIRSLSAGPSEADKSVGIDTAAEAKFLASVDIRAGPSLEGRLWPALGFEGCVKVKEGTWGGSVIIDEVNEGVGREAYIMRPIVSVHVSVGTGGAAAGAAGEAVAAAGSSGGATTNTTLPAASPQRPDIPALMFLAHRLRRYVPHLRHVWLTASVPDVSNELSEHRDWTFHSAGGSMDAHDGQSWPSGLEGSLGTAMGATASMLSQLLIASESDYFVGALSSSSAKLLNEFRCTNGRLLSGFISLDQ
ncbi:unnamed protein product [Closterium sp. NIES-64]|nr:unnamed protein product [Closterium sp. NIES-64]